MKLKRKKEIFIHCITIDFIAFHIFKEKIILHFGDIMQQPHQKTLTNSTTKGFIGYHFCFNFSDFACISLGRM